MSKTVELRADSLGPESSSMRLAERKWNIYTSTEKLLKRELKREPTADEVYYTASRTLESILKEDESLVDPDSLILPKNKEAIARIIPRGREREVFIDVKGFTAHVAKAEEELKEAGGNQEKQNEIRERTWKDVEGFYGVVDEANMAYLPIRAGRKEGDAQRFVFNNSLNMLKAMAATRIGLTKFTQRKRGGRTLGIDIRQGAAIGQRAHIVTGRRNRKIPFNLGTTVDESEKTSDAAGNLETFSAQGLKSSGVFLTRELFEEIQQSSSEELREINSIFGFQSMQDGEKRYHNVVLRKDFVEKRLKDHGINIDWGRKEIAEGLIGGEYLDLKAAAFLPGLDRVGLNLLGPPKRVKREQKKEGSLNPKERFDRAFEHAENAHSFIHEDTKQALEKGQPHDIKTRAVSFLYNPLIKKLEEAYVNNPEKILPFLQEVTETVLRNFEDKGFFLDQFWGHKAFLRSRDKRRLGDLEAIAHAGLSTTLEWDELVSVKYRPLFEEALGKGEFEAMLQEARETAGVHEGTSIPKLTLGSIGQGMSLRGILGLDETLLNYADLGGAPHNDTLISNEVNATARYGLGTVPFGGLRLAKEHADSLSSKFVTEKYQGDGQKPLGTYSAKGLGRVEVYQLIRSLDPGELYVRREEDLRKVKEILGKEKSITLRGDAGVGKSVFLDLLKEQLSSSGISPIRIENPSQHEAPYQLAHNFVSRVLEEQFLDSLSPERRVQEINQGKFNLLKNAVESVVEEDYRHAINVFLGHEAAKPGEVEFIKDLTKEGIIKLLNRGVERKKAFFLEDLHFADTQSLNFLSQIHESVEKGNNSFVFTSRPGEKAKTFGEKSTILDLGVYSGEDFKKAVELFAQRRNLQLERDGKEVYSIGKSYIDESGKRQIRSINFKGLEAMTARHPLQLSSLLNSLLTGGNLAHSHQRSVTARLSSVFDIDLSESQRYILKRAALGGKVIDEDVLYSHDFNISRNKKLSHDEVVDALEDLEEKGIIKKVEDTLQFSHDEWVRISKRMLPEDLRRLYSERADILWNRYLKRGKHRTLTDALGIIDAQAKSSNPAEAERRYHMVGSEWGETLNAEYPNNLQTWDSIGNIWTEVPYMIKKSSAKQKSLYLRGREKSISWEDAENIVEAFETTDRITHVNTGKIDEVTRKELWEGPKNSWEEYKSRLGEDVKENEERLQSIKRAYYLMQGVESGSEWAKRVYRASIDKVNNEDLSLLDEGKLEERLKEIEDIGDYRSILDVYGAKINQLESGGRRQRSPKVLEEAQKWRKKLKEIKEKDSRASEHSIVYSLADIGDKEWENFERYDSAESYLLEAEDRINSLPLKEREENRLGLYCLGKIYFSKGNSKLEKAKKTGPSPEEKDTILEEAEESFKKSIHFYNSLEKMDSSFERPTREFRQYAVPSNLGSIYHLRGNLREASDKLEEATKMSESISEISSKRSTLYELSEVKAKLGKISEGRKYFEKAEDLGGIGKGREANEDLRMKRLEAQKHYVRAA